MSKSFWQVTFRKLMAFLGAPILLLIGLVGAAHAGTSYSGQNIENYGGVGANSTCITMYTSNIRPDPGSAYNPSGIPYYAFAKLYGGGYVGGKAWNGSALVEQLRRRDRGRISGHDELGRVRHARLRSAL